MYVGSLDADAESQSRQRILAGRVPATFANGYVLFPREGTLMAQPFDVRRLELEGVPVPVAEDVRISWYYTGSFSASDNGVLAYRTASAPGTFQLTWVDRQGKTLSTVGTAGPDRSAALSPDGTRAVVKDSPYNVPGDLWTLDMATGRRTRLTFNKEVYSAGVWSPEGDRIAYSAGQIGDTIYEKAANDRADLLALAANVLDQDGLKALDGKDMTEVRRAIIVANDSGAEERLKGKDAAYIESYFDAVKAQVEAKGGDSDSAGDSVAAARGLATPPKGGKEKAGDSLKAYQESFTKKPA
jgi:hypothetical protein